MANAAALPRTIRHRRFDALRVRIRLRWLGARLSTVAAVAVAFGGGAVVTDARVDDEGPPSATPLVEIAIAAEDLPAGRTITADDLALRAVPADGILVRPADEPIGRTVSSPIFRGEPVSEARLAASGRLGLLAGEVAVGIVPPLAPLPVASGDVVTLVALEADPLGGAGARTLGQARVVAVDEQVIALAVPGELAPSVLTAQAVGTVELALTPWTP